MLLFTIKSHQILPYLTLLFSTIPFIERYYKFTNQQQLTFITISPLTYYGWYCIKRLFSSSINILNLLLLDKRDKNI